MKSILTALCLAAWLAAPAAAQQLDPTSFFVGSDQRVHVQLLRGLNSISTLSGILTVTSANGSTTLTPFTSSLTGDDDVEAVVDGIFVKPGDQFSVQLTLPDGDLTETFESPVFEVTPPTNLAPTLQIGRVVEHPCEYLNSVKVRYLTNRGVDPTLMYGATRAAGVTYGSAEVACASTRGTQRLKASAVKQQHGSISNHQAGLPFSNAGYTREVLVIHGFNNSFQAAMVRAAMIANMFNLDDRKTVVTLLSWPTESTTNPARVEGVYSQSMLDCRKSQELLRDYLRTRDQNLPLSIVCHSMGCRLTLEALASGALDYKPLKNVILVAADVDVPTGRAAISKLINGRANFVGNFFNTNDLALLGSDLNAGSLPSNLYEKFPGERVGHREETLGLNPGGLAALDNFRNWDASEAQSWWEGFGHSYIEANSVIALIKKQLLK